MLVSEFFAEAMEMRAAFEAAVGPDRTVVSRKRFVWDYWFVAGQYLYFRTFAREFFPASVYRRFIARLRAWGAENLGSGSVSEPWLSYYIDRCRQELHTDASQGPWAFIFSLTNWEKRRFSGGETILLRPEALDYWRHFEPGRPLEGRDLFDRMPPRFNQLTIFDARVPHGVASVEGSSNPLDSRVVLHGWFLPPTVVAEGTLSFGDVEPLARTAHSDWRASLVNLGKLNGLVTTRLQVNAGGIVESAEVLVTTVVARSAAAAEQSVALALQRARMIRFPESRGTTTVTLPFTAADQ